MTLARKWREKRGLAKDDGWMKIDDVELLAALPERLEAFGGEFLVADTRADLDAAEAEFVDAAIEFLDGEIGVLQRHRAETDEALGVILDLAGDAVIDDLARLVAERSDRSDSRTASARMRPP